MRIDVITIFPDYLAPLSLSLVGKTIEANIVDLTVHDLHWQTHDRHHTTDDIPCGGGAGMAMRPEPWGGTMGVMEHPNPAPMTVVVPTPTGRVLDQDLAYELNTRGRLVSTCGCYGGIDQRVLDHCAESYELIEVSLGDYALNGEEVAVLTITKAMVRLILGVIGNPGSLVEESYAPGHRLLECPDYTKPLVWRGCRVPPVLLSGNRAAIATWRREQALERIRQCRPDLFQNGS